MSHAKYLGVTLNEDLSWSPHISAVVVKAHQRLGFIRRNLRGSPFKSRETPYISLVRSHLDYCASIWDPHLKQDSNDLEKVQRKAAHSARGQYGITSVTGLLRDLKWQPLADRRRDQRLTLLYKILNGHISIQPDSVNLVRSKRPARGQYTNPINWIDLGLALSPLHSGIPPSSTPYLSGIPYLLLQQRLALLHPLRAS